MWYLITGQARFSGACFFIYGIRKTNRGEDPDALAQLAAEYNAEFHPTTPRQRDLVDTLVRNEWKIRRRCLPLRSAFLGLEDRLERLQRRLHAYERSTQRTLKQLNELRNSETPGPELPP